MNTTAFGSALFAWLLLLLLRPHSGSGQLLDTACGIRAPAITGKVIGGAIAEINSSPWMAFLQSTDNRFICAGTLITHRFVLTAAHCFLPNTQLIVRLGEYQREGNETCHNTASGPYCTVRAEHYVDLAIRHRLYDGSTHANDIALLRTATSVVYRDNIRPICIILNPMWRTYIDRINFLTGTGWGKTESERDSDYLRTLRIERQDADQCGNYIRGRNLARNQFCAGNLNSNLCNGDSGGPVGAMVPIGKTMRFIQVGIASYTNLQCALTSVFTDVLSHADWIYDKVRRFGNGQPVPRQVHPQNRSRQRRPAAPTRHQSQVLRRQTSTQHRYTFNIELPTTW